MWMDRADLVFEQDIVYGRGGGRDLEFDVLRPRDHGSPRPAVIWIHGGGWREGSRDWTPNDLLAVRGFVTASISYRLSGEAIFPAQIHDVKAAIRFLRSNAARWDIDPDRLGVWGHSAGGHLAALAALTAGNAELEGAGGYPEASSAVQAAVALSPPTDLVTDWAEMTDLPLHPEWTAVSEMLGGDHADPAVRERARLASPVAHVGAAAPPVLVVHGARDDLVPVAHGRSLVTRLRDAGADARLIELPEDGHDIPSVFGLEGSPPTSTMRQIIASFEETLGPVPDVI
jgi:acetyl esterase/lipase